MMIIEAILDEIWCVTRRTYTAQVIFVVVRKFGWTIGSMKWVQFQFCNSWNVGIGMSWWGEWMLEFRYRSLQAPYSVLIRKFSLRKFKFSFLSIRCCVEKWLANLRKNHKSNIGNLCSILFFRLFSLFHSRWSSHNGWCLSGEFTQQCTHHRFIDHNDNRLMFDLQ